MNSVILAALAIGFVSGFKHAFEPDHVVAVSTLLRADPRPLRAIRTGMAWGAGHTTTLLIGAAAIGALRIRITPADLAYFEIPVAFLLLGLGAWALVDGITRALSLRRHTHDGIEHSHVEPHRHPHGFALKRTGWRGFAVGLVHGLAGSGALLLLVAATLPSAAACLAYALIFGLGSILGMATVTLILALPFAAARTRPLLYSGLVGVSGALSVILGTSILAMFG